MASLSSSSETFNELLNIESPHLARQDTSMQNCIPAENILAIGYTG